MRTSNKQLHETAASLNTAAIHLLRAMRSTDRLSGLTAARLSALSVLVFGGPSTLGRLADIEGVAGPTMTRIVDGLEELGLATREIHPESRRSVRISATLYGEQVMREARERRLDAIVAALRLLPTDDRQQLVMAAPSLLRLVYHVAEDDD